MEGLSKDGWGGWERESCRGSEWWKGCQRMVGVGGRESLVGGVSGGRVVKEWLGWVGERGSKWWKGCRRMVGVGGRESLVGGMSGGSDVNGWMDGLSGRMIDEGNKF